MMFSIHLRALAITGLLVVQVNIAAAQPSGAIRGVIIDELGRPIGEATVVVSGLSEANTEETQTTSDGQYAYSGITPGLYTITAAKDVLGSEVFRIRVRDSHTVSVNFELAPGQRVAAYLFEAGEREALSRAFTTGIEATRSDEYEVAVDAFNAALDLSPTCLECHYNLAIAYTNIGRFDDAEVEFQSVSGRTTLRRTMGCRAFTRVKVERPKRRKLAVRRIVLLSSEWPRAGLRPKRP